jgi:cell division transport system permease protein
MNTQHFRSALKHIRRSPFQALSAFFVLTLTFFVITLISITAYSSEKVIQYFETRPQIIAFLKDEATSDSVASLQDSLKKDPRVAKVNYVTKEDALEIYKKATSDNPLLTELVSPSIFPASLEVSLNNLSYAQEVIDQIKKSQVTEQVGFTAALGGEDSLTSVVERLRTIAWYIRVGGGAFALILTCTSFLVLIVIVGMRMTTRRGEIEILNLIGATPGFIRSPIVWEALIYCVSGAFFGWLLSFLIVLYGAPSVISYFGEIPILPHDSLELFKVFGLILVAELSISFVLAITGSMLAVSRVKRR